MTARAERPDPVALPIPDSVRPDRTWSPLMRELAALIGPRATLAVIEAWGGQLIYVPKDPANSPFAETLTADQAAAIADAYATTYLKVPVGKAPLARARRAGVIAAVRLGRLANADAAKLLGTSRAYVSQLVNSSDEGKDVAPIALPRRPRDPRQIDMFPDAAE